MEGTLFVAIMPPTHSAGSANKRLSISSNNNNNKIIIQDPTTNKIAPKMRNKTTKHYPFPCNQTLDCTKTHMSSRTHISLSKSSLSFAAVMGIEPTHRAVPFRQRAPLPQGATSKRKTPIDTPCCDAEHNTKNQNWAVCCIPWIVHNEVIKQEKSDKANGRKNWGSLKSEISRQFSSLLHEARNLRG